MNPEHQPDPRTALFARRLESAAEGLVADFGRALLASGSVFTTSEPARVQAQGQLRHIIRDIVNRLSGQGPVQPVGLGLSWEIGLDRAREQVHPADSLTTARLLSRTVIDWALAQVAEEGELRGYSLVDFFTELNVSLTFRINEAATWYAGYLLNQIHHAHRAERRRVARDLHDQVSYGVVEAKRRLDAHRSLRVDSPERAEEEVERARAMLDTALSMIHKLIGDLRAEVLNLGLALRGLLREAALDGVGTKIEVKGDENRVPQDARTEVFLIIREALWNAIRHARAQEISVLVTVEPFLLTAIVDDNGTGPDLPRSQHAAETGGHGIVGMRERAELLGGGVTVSNRPGGGTRMRLSVPLSEGGA